MGLSDLIPGSNHFWITVPQMARSAGLTVKQLRVSALLADGLTQQEAARTLNMRQSRVSEVFARAVARCPRLRQLVPTRGRRRTVQTSQGVGLDVDAL